MTMPPLAVPSSLVSTMPVMSTTSAKTRACTRPFCPVVASSTSSTSSSGACFSTTRLTLPSSSMRPVLVCSRPAVSMSTASAPISLPSLTASNATEAGSPALRAAHGVGADPLAPGLELVRGGGAEGVRGAEDDGVAVGDQDAGELAGGGGLAGAVDADDHHDAGAAVGVLRVHGAVHLGTDQRDQLLAEQSAQLLGGAGAEHLDPLAQPVDQLLGGLDADVGGEQGVLDLLPGVLVEVLAGQQGEQALAQGVLRPGQPGAQPDQTAGGGLRDLDLGSLGGGRFLDDDGTGARRKINLLDGAPRFLPRRLGLFADVRLGRRGGDVGRGGRRRGQRLLAPAPDDEPAERAEHDHGDDYSKDDDVHNPSSISHAAPEAPAPDAPHLRRPEGRGERAPPLTRPREPTNAAAPARTRPNRGGWGWHTRGAGQRGGDPAPRVMGEEGRQPISSSRLPFVSFTNFSTNGIDSAANTV